MSLQPSVRLVAEGSGDFIGDLPQSASTRQANDEIVYTEVGGATVTYKIERVQFVCEWTMVSNPEAADRYSVYGRTDLIVSVV